jgi:hypothetical protein
MLRTRATLKFQLKNPASPIITIELSSWLSPGRQISWNNWNCEGFNWNLFGVNGINWNYMVSSLELFKNSVIPTDPKKSN